MRAAAIAALLVGAATVAALEGPQERPPVTFRVAVNYVEIDAVVTDAQGRFVRGLSQDDFELYEDGAAQKVTAFSLVDLPIQPADPPLSRTAPIEPDTRTNLEPFDGRVLVLILDDLHTDLRRTDRVRAAAKQFIERHVGANDLVAVIHTGQGTSAGQDFTHSRTRLFSAIDAFSGRKLTSATQTTLDDYMVQRESKMPRPARDTMQDERTHLARRSLGALRGASEFLAGIRGRRKAIVWFSEGIDYMTDDPVSARSADVVRDEMRSTFDAAGRAGVSFYTVDPRGLGSAVGEALAVGPMPLDPDSTISTNSFMNEVRRSQDFLREMAEGTGGFATLEQNGFAAAFERIIRENSAYYLFGYYPTNEKADGKFRKIEVRVKRPGLSVRTRPGYGAPRGRGTAPAGGGDTGASPEVRAALASPVPVSDLGFRAFAAPFAGPGRKTSVLFTLEFDPRRLSFARNGELFEEEIEVVIVPVDAAGKVHDGARDIAPLKLSQKSFDLVRSYGLRLARRLDLSPGRYQLRIAAGAKNARRSGSLRVDLEVPDFTRLPLAVSGIGLTSAAAASIPTPPPDKDFLETVADVPTALRDFASIDTLGYFVEVYDNRTQPAHTVTIASTITADDGRVVHSATEERESREIQGTSGGFGHARRVPLKDFAAGRYVLRVEAKSSLAGVPAAVREIEFRVRQAR